MTSFKDLIARWPTLAEFHRAVGVPYQRARKWRDRNSIPPAYWSAVITACRNEGYKDVSFEALAELSREAA